MAFAYGNSGAHGGRIAGKWGISRDSLRGEASRAELRLIGAVSFVKWLGKPLVAALSIALNAADDDKEIGFGNAWAQLHFLKPLFGGCHHHITLSFARQAVPWRQSDRPWP